MDFLVSLTLRHRINSRLEQWQVPSNILYLEFGDNFNESLNNQSLIEASQDEFLLGWCATILCIFELLAEITLASLLRCGILFGKDPIIAGTGFVDTNLEKRASCEICRGPQWVYVCEEDECQKAICANCVGTTSEEGILLCRECVPGNMRLVRSEILSTRP